MTERTQLTLLSFSKPTKIAQKWDSLDLYLTVVRTHTHTHSQRERERERRRVGSLDRC